jgi:hypothetical protein
MEMQTTTSWMTIEQLSNVLHDISKINATWDDIFNKDDATLRVRLEMTNTSAGPIVRLVIPN